MLSVDPTDAERRAVGHALESLPRPAWLRRRFAALDQLTREGRVHEIEAAGTREHAWDMVLDAAAGLRWGAAAWAILGALGQGTRLEEIARAVRRKPAHVRTVLARMRRWGMVERWD